MKRQLGLLTAIAIGDSFGRAFEFATKDKIEKELNLSVYSPGLGKYPDGYKGGTGKYTDDTQMSIAIAEHMLLEKPITHNDYAELFLLAYNRDKRNGYSKRIQNLLENSNNVDAFQHNIGIQRPRNSNGCIMRCLPLGLYPDINMLKHACVVQASLTHPTLDCILAAQVVALSVHYLYYGSKKTYISWMTDHIPSPMFNYVFDYYTLGRQVNCDAIETASYCLNVIFRQSKFKKLVPSVPYTAAKYVEGKWVGGAYTTTPDATMSQILRHSITVGGDVDSTAAICMGLATLQGAKNDLDISLFKNLENGQYGRDFLVGMDKKLVEKFPKEKVKPEKVKVKVETIAEREEREKKEKKEKEKKEKEKKEAEKNKPIEEAIVVETAIVEKTLTKAEEAAAELEDYTSMLYYC